MAETEQQLVQRAQNAVSRCNWEVGFCAAKWTERYARGRTDADFAAMVGLSADQIYQRRRVAEIFGETHENYSSLKWSHFYTSLTWEDAGECLHWAEENQATVAEMKAWRRAIRGEDLTSEPPADDFAGDPAIVHVSGEPKEVKDVNGNSESNKTPGVSKIPGVSEDRAATLAGVSRNHNGDDYAPFRADAGSPPPAGSDESGNLRTIAMKPSTLRVIKRATVALNRVNEALTDEVIDDFDSLPRDVRERFTNAAAQLSATVAGLL